MKRALLIAGGTVGGLGAVLSITPPQLGSQGAMGGLSTLATAAATTAAPAAQTSAAAQTTTTPVATTPSATSATPKAVAKKKKRVVKKRKVAVAKTTPQSNSSATAPATTAANTPAPAPAPVKSTAPAPAPAPKKVSGTFTGSVVNVNYGNVQVQITVVDGKITDAQALQAPSNGRSGSISQQAIPMLRQQTLAAQSSAIQGVGGASYTSYGWYTSLQSALSKAGLPL